MAEKFSDYSTKIDAVEAAAAKYLAKQTPGGPR